MKFSLGFVFVSFLVLGLFLVGLFNFLTNYESNRCNMTYMYEYPQLVRISLTKEGGKMSSKYGLYAYGEGKMISRLRDMRFNGIPVLFIPGNRGSPKQVRSLASVSLTKASRSRTPFTFDFFAVDLNEDFSGLYGGFLEEQTTFVNICIKKVLSLYEKGSIRKIKPSSIVLVAHSMGGMIAKGLFLNPEFNPKSISLLITLATPHSPALLGDPLIASYYESVNSFWAEFNTSEYNINLISIGGGPRDLLVRSDLTMTPHADVNVVAPVIPDVWMSVDHLCILWCKELVLSIMRLLFDSVDLKTNLISEDMELRRNIINYHLLNRSAGKSYHASIFPDTVDLFNESGEKGDWIEMTESQYTWNKKKGVLNEPTYIIISLATSSDTLTLHAINHENRDWIFTCVSQTNYNGMKKCKSGNNLSLYARISPTESLKRKTAVINLAHLRRDRFTHIVVRTLPTKEFVQIHLDLFKKRDRFVSGSSYYLMKNVIIPSTENRSLYYNIELPEVTKYWHNHEVHVIPYECPLSVFGVAAYRVPWSNEGSTTLLSGASDTVAVTLLTQKPSKSPSPVYVELYLSPNCTYKISVESSLTMALGAIVSRYGVVLISHITVCLLLTLAYQIKSLGQSSECPLLHFIMPIVAKPYFVVQSTMFVGAIAQSLAGIFSFLPNTDIKDNVGIAEVIVIPLFLHLSAFAITYFFAAAVLVSVAVQGQAFNGVFLKFINKFLFGLTWLSEYVMSGVSKVPIVVAAFMITVTSSACGGLALSIGLFFYFFKLISLYEDFWEEIVYWPLKVLKWKLKQRRAAEPTEMPRFELPPIKDISFHLTLMLLWAVSAFINTPSVLVWAKNYKYNTTLIPDPTFWNAIIMSVCAGFLWQVEMPKTGLVWSKPVGYVVVGSSILIMIYAQTSIYRISYILSGVFVLVTLHQLTGSFFTVDDDSSVPELVPIEDDEPTTMETDNTQAELHPFDPDSDVLSKEILDNSDDDVNELEDDKNAPPPANEKAKEGDSPSEASSSSSFEHISEQEQF